MKKRWCWTDLIAIRTALCGYGALILVVVLIGVYGHGTVDSLEERYQSEVQQKRRLQEAEIGLGQVKRMQTVPAYRRLQLAGDQKVPPKMAWIEFIGQLHQQRIVRDLRFELGLQRPLKILQDIETILSARFYETPVTMTATMDRESALLKLLDRLNEIPATALITDGCDLVRRSQAKDGIEALAPRLQATCRMRFVYLISSPVTP